MALEHARNAHSFLFSTAHGFASDDSATREAAVQWVIDHIHGRLTRTASNLSVLRNSSLGRETLGALAEAEFRFMQVNVYYRSEIPRILSERENKTPATYVVVGLAFGRLDHHLDIADHWTGRVRERVVDQTFQWTEDRTRKLMGLFHHVSEEGASLPADARGTCAFWLRDEADSLLQEGLARKWYEGLLRVVMAVQTCQGDVRASVQGTPSLTVEHQAELWKNATGAVAHPDEASETAFVGKYLVTYNQNPTLEIRLALEGMLPTLAKNRAAREDVLR